MVSIFTYLLMCHVLGFQSTNIFDLVSVWTTFQASMGADPWPGFEPQPDQIPGGSPGLVVMGRDSSPKGHEFKSGTIYLMDIFGPFKKIKSSL